MMQWPQQHGHNTTMKTTWQQCDNDNNTTQQQCDDKDDNVMATMAMM